MIKQYYFKKGKLNTIEVQISKALIDSYIGHDDFVSVNNARKYKKQLLDIREVLDTGCCKNCLQKGSP